MAGSDAISIPPSDMVTCAYLVAATHKHMPPQPYVQVSTRCLCSSAGTTAPVLAGAHELLAFTHGLLGLTLPGCFPARPRAQPGCVSCTPSRTAWLLSPRPLTRCSRPMTLAGNVW